MLRFSLNDLFFGVTLIAAGFWTSCFSLSSAARYWIWWPGEVPFGLWIVGGALVGSGVFLPFKQAAIGAVLGAFVQICIVYTAAVRL